MAATIAPGNDAVTARHESMAQQLLGYAVRGDNRAAGAWLRRAACDPMVDPWLLLDLLVSRAGVPGASSALARQQPGEPACSVCGSRLSRYNPGKICQACISAGRRGQRAGSIKGVFVSGKTIARLRRDRGMTQQLLADKAGISSSLVEKLEGGFRKSAKISSLDAIASVLGVPLDAFVQVAFIPGIAGSGLCSLPGGSSRAKAGAM